MSSNKEQSKTTTESKLADPEKPISIDEAAKYLGFSKSYLYKLTSSGKIPHYKPAGKVLFFKKSDLNDWITRNKIENME